MLNYPMSNGSHDQERRSKIAFINAVPQDLFIIREESEIDYGIDIILELKMQVQYAINYRVYVQMKDKILGKRNADGSFSYQVPVSTINYLHNQPNSIFVIYLENENSFVWEWIAHIVKYAKDNNTDLVTTDKQFLSYRFLKMLDPKAFREIYTKAFQSGENIKKLNEMTMFALPDENINFTYDSSTKEIKTAYEYVELCKKYGIALANNGKYTILEDWFSSIPDSYKNDADYALIVAYVKMNNGEYFEALSFLPRGIKLTSLSKNYLELAEYMNLLISNVLEFFDSNEFLAKMENFKIKYPNSLYTLQTELREQRTMFFETFRIDKIKFKAAADDLANTIRILKNISIKNTYFNFYINTIEFEIESFKWLMDVAHQYFLIKGREDIGYPFTLNERLEMVTSVLKKHSVLYESFLNLYNSTDNEILKSIIYISYANYEMYFYSNSSVFNSNSPDHYKLVLQKIESSLLWSISTLQNESHLYESLRGGLALSNCLYGLGRKDEAFEYARKSIQYAETYGISDIINSANDILSGKAIFSLNEYLKKSVDDMYLGKLSESELYRFATDTMELMGLPQDRLENVLIELRWLQKDDIENNTFCRYLRCIQDLSHTIDLENAYSINPNRTYICELFRYRSPISGVDREKLIYRFKSDYCLGCNRRLPK